MLKVKRQSMKTIRQFDLEHLISVRVPKDGTYWVDSVEIAQFSDDTVPDGTKLYGYRETAAGTMGKRYVETRMSWANTPDWIKELLQLEPPSRADRFKD